MSGGHTHGHASARAGARHAHRLWWAFTLVAGLLVVEVGGGVLTGSLALLSDAGHMLTDAVGLGMAVAAIHLSCRPATSSRGVVARAAGAAITPV